MNIEFYTIQDDARKIVKTLGTATTVSGTLRAECSMLNPIIEFEFAGAPEFNYVYIPDFNRYYYITNIESTYNGLWRIHMHVDVLMSWKDELLNTTMIANRQENLINYYLNDNQIPCNSYRNITTHIFSEGASFRDGTETNPYVLIVAGGDTI